MTNSIHPAQQIRAKYRKYQVIALCCTIITVAAALLAALSGLQLTNLRNEQEKSVANATMTAPLEPVLPQPDPALEKELETAVHRLAEAQRQIATERENVRKLMVRIAELERQLAEAANRTNQLEKERSAAPPPPKTQAEPIAPAPAPSAPAPDSAPAPTSLRRPNPTITPQFPSATTIQPPPSQILAIEPAQSPAPMPAAITEPTPAQMLNETESGKPSTESVLEPATSVPPLTPRLAETPPRSTEVQEQVADVQKQPSAELEAYLVREASEIQETPPSSAIKDLIEETILPDQNE